MDFSSKLLENAVYEMSQLPGIGKRTALRLVLHLLKQPEERTGHLANALKTLRDKVKFCISCHNISDVELCEICASPKRDESLVCVVEDIRDVMAIENTLQFKGVYHVLGGLISPMDGIGPNDLSIDELISKIENKEVKEIIFALAATMEGDTTNFYIYKKLNNTEIKTTILSRGVAVGDELAYADDITLGNSIKNRTLFELNFHN